ncbi:MAG: hypothetical protein ACIARR_01645 [Phycisphaerales bacterium JB059]
MIGSSTPYDIARPVRACASTGRAIEVGETYIAVLVDSADADALTRQDFSLEAWESGARPEAPGEVFAFWRTVAPEPTEQKKPLIDDDELMDLFEQLGESEDEERLAFRYLLALVLVRKRRLIYEGGAQPDRKSGRSGLMYVRPKGVALPPERGGDGPPLLEVVDPGLDDETIASVTEQLGQIMNLDEDPS